MRSFSLMLLFLQVFNISFFYGHEVDIFFNSLGDNVGKDLFEEFLGVSKIQNENVTQNPDKKNLNIFNSNNEKITLMEILSKNCLSYSEKICLVLYLNNPSANIFEIKKRQNILSKLRDSEVFYEMKNILFLFLKKEQIFLNTILYPQKYENKSNKEICKMLLSIQYFLKTIKILYEIIINNEVLFDSLKGYISNIAKIVKKKEISGSFIQTLDFFLKKKIKNKHLCFCRNEKIEFLKNIYDYKNWIIGALYEFSQIFMFLNIAQSKLGYTFARFYNREEKSTPYLKIEGMQNIYNEKVINDTFILKLNKTGKFIIMRLNKLFHDNITTKVLFVNIYLAQVFGIVFANSFELTAFNKIDTQIDKIV